MMRLIDPLTGMVPLAAMKVVRPAEPEWLAISPDMIAYGLFGALALVMLYVFSR